MGFGHHFTAAHLGAAEVGTLKPEAMTQVPSADRLLASW